MCSLLVSNQTLSVHLFLSLDVCLSSFYFTFSMYLRTHSSIVPQSYTKRSSCRRHRRRRSMHSLSLSLALPTCCFTYTRKKSRLTPRGYSRGRQYDVSSLVAIRRRQTDNHREKKRNNYWHSALFFLF